MKTKKADGEDGGAATDEAEKPEKTEKTDKAETGEAGGDEIEKENYVVTSKVKGFVKGAGFNCAGNLPSAVSKKIAFLLKGAIRRATANGRKTIRPCDL